MDSTDVAMNEPPTLSEIINILQEDLNGSINNEPNIESKISSPEPMVIASQQITTVSSFNAPAAASASASTSSSTVQNNKPYIKIIEQPASKSLRFRYECEGRLAGSIPGVNSTPENRTYPTIEIVNYTGEAIVLVSCVTNDNPPKAHPHKLVGRELCRDGVCRLLIRGPTMRAVFSNVGIQCVKRQHIQQSLKLRKERRVDPFNQGFDHVSNPNRIDLNSLRLCFQAFINTPEGAKRLTNPVVSEPIFDKKAISDLVICKICRCSATVNGGTEIILLCEKVVKNDIQIKFFEINSEGIKTWEANAEFDVSDIHKQTAISFKTPRYPNDTVDENAKVYVQLRRPSDGVTSEAVQFEYHPNPEVKRRRCRENATTSVQECVKKLKQYEQNFNFNFGGLPTTSNNPFLEGQQLLPEIKAEPDTSPQHFGSRRSSYNTPSPYPISVSPNYNIQSPASAASSLKKSLSATSQSSMNQVFNFNSQATNNSPVTPNGNLGQSFQMVPNNSISPIPQQNNNNNNNNFGQQQPYNATFTIDFTNQNFNNTQNYLPTTSGGSITPLSMDNNNSHSPIFQTLLTQQQQQQQQQQFQLQQQPNLVSTNGINMNFVPLTNSNSPQFPLNSFNNNPSNQNEVIQNYQNYSMTTAITAGNQNDQQQQQQPENGSDNVESLSGLFQALCNDPLMNITNSDELRISNISMT